MLRAAWGINMINWEVLALLRLIDEGYMLSEEENQNYRMLKSSFGVLSPKSVLGCICFRIHLCFIYHTIS